MILIACYLIIFLGSLKVCVQQLKLLMSKVNKKKAQEIEFDVNEEEEPVDVPDDNDSSDSNDEQSSESEDDHLHIDTQEDIRINI